MKSPTAAILVVDDSEDDLCLLQAAFRSAKIPNFVYYVESGNEAIAYLKGEGKYADRTTFPYPTFVLTDLKMSNGDGFSVLESLKLHPETPVVAAAVMSSSADLDDIHRSYRLGATSYFTKPSDYDGLKKLMQVIHNFWTACETPATDSSGRRLKTESRGKLGQRFDDAEKLQAAPPVKAATENIGKLTEQAEGMLQRLAECQELAGAIQNVSLDLDVQMARSRKLLKKQHKENFSQAIKKTDPITPDGGQLSDGPVQP
jgi:CheY-like chemotaxis protein